MFSQSDQLFVLETKNFSKVAVCGKVLTKRQGPESSLDCAMMPLLLNRALKVQATAEWAIELSVPVQMLA